MPAPTAAEHGPRWACACLLSARALQLAMLLYVSYASLVAMGNPLFVRPEGLYEVRPLAATSAGGGSHHLLPTAVRSLPDALTTPRCGTLFYQNVTTARELAGSRNSGSARPPDCVFLDYRAEVRLWETELKYSRSAADPALPGASLTFYGYRTYANEVLFRSNALAPRLRVCARLHAVLLTLSVLTGSALTADVFRLLGLVRFGPAASLRRQRRRQERQQQPRGWGLPLFVLVLVLLLGAVRHGARAYEAALAVAPPAAAAADCRRPITEGYVSSFAAYGFTVPDGRALGGPAALLPVLVTLLAECVFSVVAQQRCCGRRHDPGADAAGDDPPRPRRYQPSSLLLPQEQHLREEGAEKKRQ
ncbi:hypothetical protein STCU_11619 [Strigomonas culicis]|uniref:Uncharacterized protein n=1 Tax=Strigomonas culicis TaxID=28005 RepID=S9UMR7_9TRYP|nr:hypothetical protein STCU_11619 [Strigomonas culicis]|eukprot:EPY15996.1 hypothetical protein STCU_11619 [Strigomonas culicis]